MWQSERIRSGRARRHDVDPVQGPGPLYGPTGSGKGDEWGAGWLLPVPGCWIVQAGRPEVGAVGSHSGSFPDTCATSGAQDVAGGMF